jgi:hypothetical protein
VTNIGVDTARPPLGLATRSLLRADTIVLLYSKASIGNPADQQGPCIR